jgi:hypothetical protein
LPACHLLVSLCPSSCPPALACSDRPPPPPPSSFVVPQLLFLVRRCSPATNALMGDEWCEMCVGNLSMWLLVKNYLLQVLLLEAAYLAPPALPSPPTPEAAGAVDAASPVAGSNSPMIPAAGAGEGASPSSVAAAGSLSSGAGPWAQPCVPEGPWSHASQQQKQQQQQQQQQQQEEEVADPQSRQQLDVGEVGQQQQQQQQPLTLAARSPTDQQPAAPMVQEPGLEAAAAAPGAQYCPPLWGWLPPGGLPPPGWPSLTCPLPILPVYPPQQQLPGGSSPQALPWTYDATAAAAAAMATGSDPRLQLSGPALPCACEPMGASAAAFLGSPYASNTALVAAAAAAAAAVLAGYGGIALGRSGLGPDASSSRAATATQVLLGGPPTSMAADTALAPPAMTRDGRFSMDGYTCPSASAALGGGEGWVRWESTEQLPGTLPCPGPSAAPEGAWPSSSGAGGGVCEALAQPSCAHSH